MMSSKFPDSRLQTSEKILRRLAIPETYTKDSLKRLKQNFQNTKRLSKAKRKRSWKSSIDQSKQPLSLSKCLGQVKLLLTSLPLLSSIEKVFLSNLEKHYPKMMNLRIRFSNLDKIKN
jgi:hypothetical protein